MQEKTAQSEDYSFFKVPIAERLREFGLWRFDSISALAQALELHPASLHSHYLKGKSFPGGEILLKLHALGCDITWLLTGEGLPPEPTDQQVDQWIEACHARAKALKEWNELMRKAEDELVRNMNRFLEQQGKGEGEEENETP